MCLGLSNFGRSCEQILTQIFILKTKHKHNGHVTNVHKGPDQVPGQPSTCPNAFSERWPWPSGNNSSTWQNVHCSPPTHTPSLRFNYSLLMGSVIFHFPTALPVTPVFHLHFASRLLSLTGLPWKPLTFVFTAVEFSLQWDSISFAAVVRILLPLTTI